MYFCIFYFLSWNITVWLKYSLTNDSSFLNSVCNDVKTSATEEHSFTILSQSIENASCLTNLRVERLSLFFLSIGWLESFWELNNQEIKLPSSQIIVFGMSPQNLSSTGRRKSSKKDVLEISYIYINY